MQLTSARAALAVLAYRTTLIGCVPRSYLFYVPDEWDGETPLPLVVALHGKDSNGPAFFWRLSRQAASRKFALLAPSSLGLSWGAPPPKWALPEYAATRIEPPDLASMARARQQV